MLYRGLEVLGGGSILGGVILGAIAALIIDRNFIKAACFSAAGAILTSFGLMHGEMIGIGQTPVVAASYLIVAVLLVGIAKFATGTVPRMEHAEEREELPEGLPVAASAAMAE